MKFHPDFLSLGMGPAMCLFRYLCSFVSLLLIALPAQAEIKAKVVEKTYSIPGTTGIALYEAIGAHGPRVRDGASGAIATTNFDLKWGRDYKAEGNDCVLSVIRPFLTITYTFPKPSETLPPDLRARWEHFIKGIRAHEAVHGRYVTEMAEEIHEATLGFRQPDDPTCQKIRQTIQVPIKAAFDRYKARNQAFEQVEMQEGGNVHQLILGLVNGP
ncbi:DUF922 domain-containing protein [Rhizobium sp. L1K21]|nr:DUF922 domain-containing protein [Rhizobium sp. L1K21]